ncbi:SDR family oxidoreductase [Streptomyces sp. NPDC088766]|uniref:SDR family oxidoreductase n=1 Tax=Streptomyces sp. NPDC088766 TaxID=3365893 RepID=UPI00380CA7EC
MNAKTALIVGTSRTLGLGLATEYAHRGRDVIGTVRGDRRTGLHDLAEEASGGRATVESLDMTKPEQVAALRERLAERTLDLLFVDAAVTRGSIPIGDVPAEMFVEVMVTNALSPMHMAESFRSLVAPGGTSGIISSRQGSVSLNTNGGQDVYRAGKAAPEPADAQLRRPVRRRRAHTAAHPPRPCPHRTRRSGRTADHRPVRPRRVDTIDRDSGEPGLKFLNHQDQPVPW